MANVGDFEYVPCGDCSGEGSPPMVINISPNQGIDINPDTAVHFDVVDNNETMKRIVIYVAYPNNGIVEAIYNSTGFCPDFTSFSTITPITNGFRYAIARLGGWLDRSITITVDAISNSGAED